MVTLNQTASALIEKAYNELSQRVYHYMCRSVNNQEDARDLTQDVFVRLLEYNHILTEASISSFIFVTARNIVNDYLRHIYCAERVHAELHLKAKVDANVTEDEVSFREISALESARAEALPRQRRTIYYMSRYDEKTVGEISEILGLSTRTVENHLRLGRKEVREYVRRHIS